MAAKAVVLNSPAPSSAALSRFRWLCFLAILTTLHVSGGLLVWAYTRASGVLEEAVAELDRKDPAWRWPACVEAERPAVPDADNLVLPIAAAEAVMPNPYPVLAPPQNAWSDLAFAKEPLSALREWSEPASPTAAALKAWLAKNTTPAEPALALLQPLPTQRRARLPVTLSTDGWFRLNLAGGLPDRLPQALHLKASQAALEGRTAEALWACQSLWAVARAIEEVDSTFTERRRLRQQEALHRTLAVLTARSDAADGDLAALQQEMRDQAARPSPLPHLLRLRRGWTLAYWPNLYRKVVVHGEGGRSGESFLLGATSGMFDDALGWSLRYFDAELEAVRDPQDAVKRARTDELVSMRSRSQFPGDVSYHMGRMLGPFPLESKRWRQGQAWLILGDAALALERFRLAQGRWPARGEEVVPRFLPAWPEDPFRPGKPISFAVTTTGVKLWSVGPNGIDEGGRPQPLVVHGPMDLVIEWAKPAR